MYRKIRKNAEGGAEGAKKAALSLLAYKDNTEKELFGKLTAKGFSEEEAAEAVRFVVEKRYLCERRHFERFVEICAKSKGWGKKRILFEAQRKGFSEKTLREEAESVFEGVDFNECCYEMLKKCRAETAEKAYAALLRRGYSSSNVRAAFGMYKEEYKRAYDGRSDRRTDDRDEEN